MTNEVEKMILDNYKNKMKIDYPKNVAYTLYKQIWTFILNIRKVDYTEMNIRFNLKVYDDKYFIDKSRGIDFTITGNGINYQYGTYFENSNKDRIDTVLNTNIDIKLLLDLLKCDNIEYELADKDNNLWIYLKTNKNNLNKIIKDTLLKNKRLIRTRG